MAVSIKRLGAVAIVTAVCVGCTSMLDVPLRSGAAFQPPEPVVVIDAEPIATGGDASAAERWDKQ